MARDLGGSRRGLMVRRGRVLYVDSVRFSSGVMFGVWFCAHFDSVGLRCSGHHGIV